MTEKIIILDFGSQYTQLISRKVREQNVYCEILPYNKPFELTPDIKGVILSGSPCSVNDEDAPEVNVSDIAAQVPVLAVCYGAQLVVKQCGGIVSKSEIREYGRANLNVINNDPLFKDVTDGSQIWMSHSDTVQKLPAKFEIIAKTGDIPVAAFKTEKFAHPVYGLQFHPEVTHSEEGQKMLHEFLVGICGCKQDYTFESFVDEAVRSIKEQAGDHQVVMAISGGVDSTVAATLIHRAIGDRLHCIFVDNGLLRKNEFSEVLEAYKTIGLNVKGISAGGRFYEKLASVTDPEKKRKIIGGMFIEIFDEEAKKIEDVKFLGQGTIYPDVIESVSVKGPSVTIKSHHNVGGLPEKMNLKLIEPIRYLFKDEVRNIGKVLGLKDSFLMRHPFPGPGLGIRILGAVSEEKVKMLQEADAIFIRQLRDSGYYDKVWQAGAILLPVQSVGVMGDERTYEFTIALRAVTSVNAMTADWADLPHNLLASISSEIINHVKGINRVVYDISSKPPATIEWE